MRNIYFYAKMQLNYFFSQLKTKIQTGAFHSTNSYKNNQYRQNYSYNRSTYINNHNNSPQGTHKNNQNRAYSTHPRKLKPIIPKNG